MLVKIVTTKTYKFVLFDPDGLKEDFVFVQEGQGSVLDVQAALDLICKEMGLRVLPTYSVSISERYLIDDPNSPL